MAPLSCPEKDLIAESLKNGFFREAAGQCSKVLTRLKNNMPQPSDRENRKLCQDVFREFKEIEKVLLQYVEAFTGTDKGKITCISGEECQCGLKTVTPQRKQPINRRMTPKQRQTPRFFRNGVRKSKGTGIALTKKKIKVNPEVPVDVLSGMPKVDEEKGDGDGKKDEKDEKNEDEAFLKTIKSEDMRDVLRKCLSDKHEDTSWRSVVGLKEVKRCLYMNVKRGCQYKNIFKGGRRPLRAFLLFGPPGTGKTLIGRALAKVCKRKFMLITPSIITSKWRGESEKIIKHLFEMAEFYAPTVIFFDELDGFCMERGTKSEHEATRRFMSEFLVRFEELNQSGKDVCVIGATNTPWDIDSAVMRRFDQKLLVPLPDIEARVKIMENAMADVDVDESFDFYRVAEKLEGYSASEIVCITRRAMVRPVNDFFGDDDGCSDSDASRDMDYDVDPYLPVTEKDFDFCIADTPRTVTDEMTARYQKYAK